MLPAVEEEKKEPKKKKKVHIKLSVRIVILNLIVTFVVNLGFFITMLIIRALVDMSYFLENQNIERLVSILTLIPGIVTMILFAVAIHLLVVKRIKKLNDSTKEVAAGNYDAEVEIKLRVHDELGELAENFNKMSAELKANEYLAKGFVRNISHEYKTPLSVIKAYAEWIEGEAKDKKVDFDTLEEYARIIMNETDRMANLSKSMIQLSLLDSTTIIKKEDEFSPATQIKNILKTCQVKWADKNIEFDLQLSKGMIKSNEQLIYQVWQNLISNAVKFTDDGGNIKILLCITEQELYFELSDSGIGMSEEDREKLFTLFFMADKSRNTEGSGLGLAITQRIIDKLGGQIAVKSKEGEGTTFIVRLALEQE
ncbi:MAG: HAMP domain-containing histidine kinase [Firmicutes bacterium]|nr:HAMP domain-containing histidine kinase [Bacillota bacterium]